MAVRGVGFAGPGFGAAGFRESSLAIAESAFPFVTDVSLEALTGLGDELLRRRRVSEDRTRQIFVLLDGFAMRLANDVEDELRKRLRGQREGFGCHFHVERHASPVDFDAHFAALAARKRRQILRLRCEGLGALHISLRLGELLVQPRLNAF